VPWAEASSVCSRSAQAALLDLLREAGFSGGGTLIGAEVCGIHLDLACVTADLA
jgi:hypothetical protein